jgi:hypothetical protein
MARIDRLSLSRDSMGGGAWPFLVRGSLRLVDSDNERDRNVWLASDHTSLCRNGTPWPSGLHP